MTEKPRPLHFSEEQEIPTSKNPFLPLGKIALHLEANMYAYVEQARIGRETEPNNPLYSLGVVMRRQKALRDEVKELRRDIKEHRYDITYGTYLARKHGHPDNHFFEGLEESA